MVRVMLFHLRLIKMNVMVHRALVGADILGLKTPRCMMVYRGGNVEHVVISLRDFRGLQSLNRKGEANDHRPHRRQNEKINKGIPFPSGYRGRI